MEAGGALLWVLAFTLAAVIAAGIWLRRGALPRRADRLFVLVSWVTLPLILPLLLAVAAPTGPEMPAPLFFLAIIRVIALS